MIPAGKHLMVWKVSQILNVYVSLEAAIQAVVENGFAGIMPKIANGNYAWLPGKPEAKGLPELIALARKNSLKVHTWMYSYGQDLVGEIAAINAAYGVYGGDSFTINADGGIQAQGGGCCRYESHNAPSRRAPEDNAGIHLVPLPDEARRMAAGCRQRLPVQGVPDRLRLHHAAAVFRGSAQSRRAAGDQQTRVRCASQASLHPDRFWI